MTRLFLIPVFCCLVAASAQQPVILLDPARGGAESGAAIADRLPEKQVTLETAARLASLLRARGFTVAMTREADVDVTNDARATLANNLRPIACILLHATGTGKGVHLYTSALRQKVAGSGSPTRWDEAQAAYVERSHALGTDLKAALQHAKITATVGQTWMRPLDNMQCPAVAVEVAPEKDGTGPQDSTYQALISNALANTLLQWRVKIDSMAPPEPLPPPVAPKPTVPAPQTSATPPAKVETRKPTPPVPLPPSGAPKPTVPAGQISATPVKVAPPKPAPPAPAQKPAVNTAPADRTEP